MIGIRKREPWRRFAAKALLAGAVAAACGAYLSSRYAVAIDPQVERSMPGVRVLLIDRYDTMPQREQAYAFAARGLGPWIADGTLVAKFADGLAGDEVAITTSEVRVNGAVRGEGLALAATLGQPASHFERRFTVPDGAVFLLGRAFNSFDGRYWGPIPADRIIGRVYPLF
ncbi:S26 family signal peptidase [Azospirillum sp. sgz302134]